MNTFALDPKVAVLTDDRGRIVLLPPDRRQPIRLSPDESEFVDQLKQGITVEISSESKPLQDEKLRALISYLDRFELLAGRRRSSNKGLYHFPRVNSAVNAISSVLSAPIRLVLPNSLRGPALWLIFIAMYASILTLWAVQDWRVFAASAGTTWWIGFVFYFAVFPVVHEVGHAVVARCFGFQSDRIGVDYRNPVSWHPFVKVDRLILSSFAPARFWVPMAGVLTNLLMALVATLGLLFVHPDAMMYSALGTLVILLHLRVIIDGGTNKHTDASKALAISKELCSSKSYQVKKIAVRGFHFLFIAATILIAILSMKHLLGELGQ